MPFATKLTLEARIERTALQLEAARKRQKSAAQRITKLDKKLTKLKAQQATKEGEDTNSEDMPF